MKPETVTTIFGLIFLIILLWMTYLIIGTPA